MDHPFSSIPILVVGLAAAILASDAIIFVVSALATFGAVIVYDKMARRGR